MRQYLTNFIFSQIQTEILFFIFLKKLFFNANTIDRVGIIF
jgi:hypothetical protein